MKIQGSLFFWIPVIIFILYQIGINITEQALFILFIVMCVLLGVQHLFSIVIFFTDRCWEKDKNIEDICASDILNMHINIQQFIY